MANDARTPPPQDEPAQEPAAQEKISYDFLWQLCARYETNCWRLNRNCGPSPSVIRDQEGFVRLANMVRLFEMHETDFMAIVKRGKRK